MPGITFQALSLSSEESVCRLHPLFISFSFCNSQEASNPTYLLAWIPEALLNEKGTSEWDKFLKMEDKVVCDEEDEGLRF